MSREIIVVGGGAAGMMAAISAAENGGHVTLGKKTEHYRQGPLQRDEQQQQ